MSLNNDKEIISEAAQMLEGPFTYNALFNEAKKKGLKSMRLFYDAYKSLGESRELRIEDSERRAFGSKVKRIYRTEFLNHVEKAKKEMLENTEKLIERYSKELLKKKNDDEKNEILRKMVNIISARFGYRLITLYEFKEGQEWVRDTLTHQFNLCLRKLSVSVKDPEIIRRLKSMGYRL